MKLIDMHSHILPAIDDGSSDVQISCNILKNLADQGVTTVCVTPHFYMQKENIHSFLARRTESWELLKKELADSKQEIILGAETAYFRGISECLHLNDLCYQGTNTLLLEMPYTGWESYQYEEIISLVLDRNYQVILAHPERYISRGNNMAYLQKLMQLPIALQINAEPLLEWKNRRQALKLLQMTDYPLLGSDCHDLKMRPPQIGRARKVIERRLGKEFLEMMDECAENILFGKLRGARHEQKFE